MKLQVIGAGLPRTSTSSLARALEQLLGAPSYHMSVIPGHPFNLGVGWDQALAGETPDWDQLRQERRRSYAPLRAEGW